MTENFRMKNVEGIEMPEKVVDKNGVKYDLPHREVVVREVLPNQIYEVAEVTLELQFIPGNVILLVPNGYPK